LQQDKLKLKALLRKAKQAIEQSNLKQKTLQEQLKLAESKFEY